MDALNYNGPMEVGVDRGATTRIIGISILGWGLYRSKNYLAEHKRTQPNSYAIGVLAGIIYQLL